MKAGKMSFDELRDVILDNIKNKHINNDEVLVPTGIGEDSAVIDFGDEVLVVSSDPITGAVENAGYIAVHVACNDIAATGARPFGIQVILLLPPSLSREDTSRIMREIDDTAEEINVAVLGGHTEVLDTISKPLIIITALGKAGKDEYVRTGGACEGDQLVVTKGLGIEGTYILASDFADVLRRKGVKEEVLSVARDYGKKLSVLPEALIARELGISAMHDITEGGLYGAVWEMALASEKGFRLDMDKVEATFETEEICGALSVDPAGLISSGSLLIASSDADILIAELSEQGILAFSVGEIIAEGYKIRQKDGFIQEMSEPPEDELWRLLVDKLK
ncbi:MAG: AIR synthase family protein [Halanaerobiales bacterium]